MSENNDDVSLVDLLRRGGVFYNVAGSTPAEVLKDMAATVALPAGVEREALLKAVMEREALMPTAVGRGIAMPHPRSPVVPDPADQLVSVGFLQNPVDWQALDGRPVGTLVLILSATPKLHLRTLSRLSYLCQQEAFQRLLADRAPLEELEAAIRKAEREWK